MVKRKLSPFLDKKQPSHKHATCLPSREKLHHIIVAALRLGTEATATPMRCRYDISRLCQNFQRGWSWREISRADKSWELGCMIFLKDKCHTAVAIGNHSEGTPIISSVSQGTVLGPPLYRVTAEAKLRLEWNEASMCNASVCVQQRVTVLRDKLGIIGSDVVAWHGYIMCMNEEGCVKNCQSRTVERTRGRCRPKKVWHEMAEYDI